MVALTRSLWNHPVAVLLEIVTRRLQGTLFRLGIAVVGRTVLVERAAFPEQFGSRTHTVRGALQTQLAIKLASWMISTRLTCGRQFGANTFAFIFTWIGRAVLPVGTLIRHAEATCFAGASLFAACGLHRSCFFVETINHATEFRFAKCQLGGHCSAFVDSTIIPNIAARSLSQLVKTDDRLARSRRGIGTVCDTR